MNLRELLENGMSQHKAGKLAEAEKFYREALQQKPDDVEALQLLGILKIQMNETAAGAEILGRVMEPKPGSAEHQMNFAMTLKRIGRVGAAIEMYRRAVEIKPDYVEAWYNLGNALKDAGKVDEATAAYERAVAMRPDFTQAMANLASVLKSVGRVDEGIDLHRRSLCIQPDDAITHSALIFAMHYQTGADAVAIYRELRRWNDRHARPLAQFARPHDNDRDPERRLRIGYVSGDFRDHVAGQNILPLLGNHDDAQVEVFCYSNLNREDAITPRFRKYAHHWREVWQLNDAQLADQIRDDGIDILVDLSVHTTGNRLKAFAHKPAPVQATFAGYPGSTGMDAMDYRLTDPYLDPPESSDEFYSETSLRLPSSFWCYDPLFSDVAVNPPPAQRRGFITFGCLCNYSKVNAEVVGLWMEILKRVDRSRLMILCPEGSHRTALLKSFEKDGIAPDRIELVGPRARQEYIQLYHQIDLGLDTLPYNGHSTSLDSYWMGVPVVTLVGKTVVGRAGVSQLTNLGLTELIADTSQKYIEIAVRLARDLSRLTKLRRTLRDRMRASPLMDAIGFARGIEGAYRQMWRAWCATGGKQP